QNVSLRATDRVAADTGPDASVRTARRTPIRVRRTTCVGSGRDTGVRRDTPTSLMKFCNTAAWLGNWLRSLGAFRRDRPGILSGESPPTPPEAKIAQEAPLVVGSDQRSL